MKQASFSEFSRIPLQIENSMQRGFGSFARAFGLAIAMLFVSGCGRTGLETATVRGKVTIDGKPLTTGRVLFLPERGRTAQGEIQPDGSYTLTTYTTGDGAIVGKHRVSIRARVNAPRKSVEDESPVDSLIPEIYDDEAKSGLSAEVKSGEDNQVNFDLRNR